MGTLPPSPAAHQLGLLHRCQELGESLFPPPQLHHHPPPGSHAGELSPHSSLQGGVSLSPVPPGLFWEVRSGRWPVSLRGDCEVGRGWLLRWHCGSLTCRQPSVSALVLVSWRQRLEGEGDLCDLGSL